MRIRFPVLWMLVLALGLASVFLYQRGWLGGAENIGVSSLSPIQKSVQGILGPIGDVFTSLSQMTRLQTENHQLREQIDALSSEIVRLREISIENERLRSEIGYRKEHSEFQFLSAKIIGHDPSNVVRAVTIDQGTEQGVRDGMVVVSSSGLVGKVTKALGSYSKVLLIVDSSASVNGMLQREDSRAFGVLYGWPRDKLYIKYLPQAAEVKENDLIITSGVGGGYPKGLLIGRVASVKRNDIEMFQEAFVDPTVRFDNLENVMVIVNFSPRELEKDTR